MIDVNIHYCGECIYYKYYGYCSEINRVKLSKYTQACWNFIKRNNNQLIDILKNRNPYFSAENYRNFF